MSKILLFTDNHFCSTSSIVRSKGKKYSSRLENQIESLNWINTVAINEKVDKIICLGDFFDSPNLNAEELSALKEVNWCDIPKEFIVGNHEMGSADLEFNSTNALSKIGKVISKPTIDSGYGYELIYLPYILETNRKSLQEYINDLEKEYWADSWTTQEVKYRIILSHNDLAGIRFGQFESKVGFNIKEIEDNCNLFINGHLHNQQQISKKILNLGNVTGQNFSEDGFKFSHCLAILDTDTLKVNLINNPYAFYFYKIDSYDSVIEHQDVFSNEFSIATIKVNQSEFAKARDLCENLFKEYRLLTFNDSFQKNNLSMEKLLVTDHIKQFVDYCLKTLDNDETLNNELSLLI